MALPRLPRKDPDAVVDYGIDWVRWLAGDTLLTSVWLVPSGIVEDSSSNTATAATIWLSGGTVGLSYRLTNRVTTVGLRTQDQTVTIPVRAR